MIQRPRQKTTGSSQDLLRQLLAVIPMLLVAVLCYSVSVYAWFSDSIANSGNQIQSADYSVTVTVDGTAYDGAALEAGQSYTVVLTAAGTASTGYCRISSGDTVYVSDQMAPGETLSFTLIPAQQGVWSFEAVWGQYDGIPKATQRAVLGTTQTELPVPGGGEEQTADQTDAAVPGTEETEPAGDTAQQGADVPAGESQPGTQAPEQSPGEDPAVR